MSAAAVCIEPVGMILGTARDQSLRTANATMVSAYWHIGRENVDEEQRGQARRDYGARLMRRLSKQLTT